MVYVVVSQAYVWLAWWAVWAKRGGEAGVVLRRVWTVWSLARLVSQAYVWTVWSLAWRTVSQAYAWNGGSLWTGGSLYMGGAVLLMRCLCMLSYLCMTWTVSCMCMCELYVHDVYGVGVLAVRMW